MGIRHSSDKLKELREIAREQYASGVIVKQVSRNLQVSNSTVKTWCEDLIQARLLERASRSKIPKAEGFTGFVPLKDSDVITIRKEVRASGIKDWKRYSHRYSSNDTKIADAAKGITFKHLDSIEPPILDSEVKRKTRPVLKRGRPENITEVLKELVELIRSDPPLWPFEKLAEIARERTGKKYLAPVIARMVYQFDPSVNGIAISKPRVKPEKKRVKRSDEQRRKKDQIKNAIKRTIRKENAYEEWVAAGKPDSWVGAKV
jgi:transposase